MQMYSDSSIPQRKRMDLWLAATIRRGCHRGIKLKTQKPEGRYRGGASEKLRQKGRAAGSDPFAARFR